MRYLVQSNSESDWQLPGAGEWEGRGDRELVKYLNRSSENREPCLVPDLRRKALNLSALSMLVAVNMSCLALLC